MKSRFLLAATLLAATPALLAQDEKAVGSEMPNPKHKEHAAFAALAGTWQSVMKSEAMPGVPGMEEATESKGIERAELICNGLWLKAVVDATYQGAPFQGVWLMGYDPFAKKYRGIWVGSMEEECGPSLWDGTYDAAAKAWTWTGTTPHGEMRSVFAIKNADTTVETCYMKAADGKETKCMEITRSRTKPVSVAAADASAATKDLPPEVVRLHKDVGNWDATVKMATPGQPASESKATESVVAICGGRWLWSHFKGDMMGMPFEGHGLIGYDPKTSKYNGFWIDSMSPVHAHTTGTFDAAKKAYLLEGKSADPMGNPMQIKEVLTWKDDNTRVLQMEFKGADGTSTMEIAYKRK